MYSGGGLTTTGTPNDAHHIITPRRRPPYAAAGGGGERSRRGLCGGACRPRPPRGGSPAPAPPRACAVVCVSVLAGGRRWRCSRLALCFALPADRPLRGSLSVGGGMRCVPSPARWVFARGSSVVSFARCGRRAPTDRRRHFYYSKCCVLRPSGAVTQYGSSLRGPPPRIDVGGGPPPLLLQPPPLGGPPPRSSGARDSGVPPLRAGRFCRLPRRGLLCGLRARPARSVAVMPPPASVRAFGASAPAF